MGFLNPASLYFFALVPLLLVAYLARERPRQAIVSSVLAFRALRVMRGEHWGGRLRFSWLFLLELLILCLAVLALASPYLVRKAGAVALVIDNSAPMQARLTNSHTRFEEATVRATEALSHVTSDSTVALYETAPTAHQVSLFGSPSAAASALARIHPVDAPSAANGLSGLLTQLLADRHLGRIIVATWRPIEEPVPARITPVAADQTVANFAIGSFTLNRGALGTSILNGRVTVANFATAAQTLKVAVTADSKAVATAQAQVDPGQVAALEFPNLPPAQIYRAQLEPSDGFRLDNVAYATSAVLKTLSILFVSPTAAEGLSLKSIPGVEVTTRTPDNYSPNDLAGADLVIFEYTTPKEFPSINAWLVMPPPGDPVFDFAGKPSAQLRVTGWPTTDPLTDGVNFRLLNVRSGEYFSEHPWMRAMITGADGGLLLAGDRAGHRYLATGFNPFPYLGRQNLPMSILTLNMLGHLAGFGGQSGAFRTGDPWIIPAGIKTVTLPSGEKVTTAPGRVFTSTDQQGIYRLEGTGAPTLRAVNLADLTTSDLQNIAPLKIQSAGAAKVTEAPPVQKPLAPYILIAILALIALEALFVYRARRPVVEA